MGGKTTRYVSRLSPPAFACLRLTRSPSSSSSFAALLASQVPPNQLYFFQFPPSFPKFLPIPVAAPAEPSEKVEPMDGVEESSGPTSILKKGVSFAGDKEKERKAKEKAVKKDSKEKDSKEGILSAAKRRKEEERRKLPTGAIGSLLVMKSGKVKMRLGHDMLLDVGRPAFRLVLACLLSAPS